jgi:peptidoglycan/xylan/chitin deacetylase (PgdA/CDA1 family)
MKIFILSFIFLSLINCTPKNESKNQENAQFNDSITPDTITISNSLICAFIYHRIGDNRYPSTNTKIDEFESHLIYLKENNFKVTILGEALKILDDGPSNYEKIIVLTVDDAFLSFYENGFPLLKKYGITATLFVNTETVGGNSYANWGQIKEMMEYGIEIGNHSHSHNYFLDEPRSTRYKMFKEDVQLSQEIFSEQIDVKPALFAYPYGEFDMQIKEIVKEMGFNAGAAQNSGVIHSGSDKYLLPRFPMSSAYASMDRFKEKAKMLPLIISEVQPIDNILRENNFTPKLEIAFNRSELVMSQMQCFIQGSNCKTELKELSDGKVHLNIFPDKPLNARRTLFTITIPDKNGRWHWYSYLWINPRIKGDN